MIEYITNEVIEEKRLSTPVVFGPIGEDVYRRTYSRTKRDGNQEDWYETAARVVNGNLNYVPEHFIEKDEAEKLYKLILDMEVLPGGRHLWATGIGRDKLNNCFHGDTIVQTINGPVKIKELVGQEVELYTTEKVDGSYNLKNYSGKKIVKGICKSFGIQELYRVDFSDGQFFITTKEHNWYVAERSKPVPTDKLKGLSVPYVLDTDRKVSNKQQYQLGVCAGFVYGDGNFVGKSCSAVRIYGQAREDIVPYFIGLKTNSLKTGSNIEAITKVCSVIQHTNYTYVGKLSRDLNTFPSDVSKDYILGWFRGLLAADGCVSPAGTVLLTNKSEEFLKEVSKLITPLGYVCFEPRLMRSHNPSNPTQEASMWQMSILRQSCSEEDLLLAHHKQKFLSKPMVKTRTVECTSVTKLNSKQEVFCFEVPNDHSFVIGNWLLTSNCFSSDFTEKFSEHFEFTLMRLMEGGGVGSNYSTLFINSREGNKAWIPKSKINLHLICQPDHKDLARLLDLDASDTWVPYKAPVLGDLLSVQYDENWDPGINNGDGPIYLRVEDSREGWTKALVFLLDAHMGNSDRDVVIDFSNIRPYGAVLKGFGGKASGPDALALLLCRTNHLLNSKLHEPLTGLDMMRIDHFIAQAVVSGGVRRSARMAMKYWKDSDIFDFISCKDPSKGICNWTTNISVVIDKKFINALKRLDEHAKAVYDAIIQGMLANGEPGIINASKALEGEAPGTEFFTSNPSLHGNTKVLTDQGLIPIKELEGKLVSLYANGDWADAFVKKTGENKSLWKITFSNNQEVLCTAEHSWPTRRKGKNYVKRLPHELQVNDHVEVPFIAKAIDNQESKRTLEEGFILGWYYGDGWQSYHKNNKSLQYGFIFSDRDIEFGIGQRILNFTNSLAKTPSNLRQDHASKALSYCTTDTKVIETMEILGAGKKEDGIPETIFRGSHEFVNGFIDGLFSADGSVFIHKKYHSISSLILTSSKYKLITDIQKLLMAYGIVSFIDKQTTNLNHKKFLSYNLKISGEYLIRFNKVFTLSNLDKQEKIEILCRSIQSELIGSHHYKNGRGYLRIISSELTNQTADVYDAAVFDDTHTFMTEVGVTGNCGEIFMVRYPDMLCFDVCCLGHVNLDRAKDPAEAFRLVTRFLIRATFAKISDERQLANVQRNRRIGVGFLGYHSWLVKNKVKYSEAPNNEAVKSFFQKMKKIIDEEARSYASKLRIPEPIKKTTLAPTGSIGNLAGCTTGCQSVFSKFYIRRMRLSDSDNLVQELAAKGYKIEKDLYAANTSVVEYYCVDPIYDQVVSILKKDYLAKGDSEAKAQGLAELQAVELIEDQYELNLEDVLATQRMLQKEYVDNAISITINVDSTKQDKEELKATLRHYLPDLKGVTIFPEVSMAQTPLERITWEELMRKQAEGKTIERTQAEMICVGGCPIK